MNCEVCSIEFEPKRVDQLHCGSARCKQSGKRSRRKEIAKVEWYTPPHIIEAARTVLGEIDLDPSSSPEANRVIGASVFYTIKDRGEHRRNPWRGRVWMNPPYGKSAPVFCERLRHELKLGNVSSAIVLLSVNMTTAAWFRWMLDQGIMCFHEKRINFVRGKQTKDVPHGSVIVGLGECLNVGLFHQNFSKMGVILAPVSGTLE